MWKFNNKSSKMETTLMQDSEKENKVIILPKNNITNDVKNKMKRTTLGVLSNAALVENLLLQHGDTNNMHNYNTNNVQVNFVDKSDAESTNIEKNNTQKEFNIPKVANDGPINVTEIYTDSTEHKTKENIPENNKAQVVNNSAIGRTYLGELKKIESPVTANNSISPMSIDKSFVDDFETDRSILNTSMNTTLMNERDRFFEIHEYQSDIMLYLREAEERNRAKPGYMNKQPDINNAMRAVLVDWLVEVCEEYRLQSETLCLAVSYIDRFLSVMSVVRAKLQLVGTAALFIAAKYEEIYPPDVSEFVYITDDTYTKSQVLRMEQLVLKALSFDLCVPTPVVFTVAYSIINDIPERVKCLALYLCELSLMEADPYLYILPSKVSSSALALARFLLKEPMWNTKLENTTGYNIEQLKQVILCLNKTLINAPSLKEQAIREKYKLAKHMQVTNILPIKLTNEMFESINNNDNTYDLLYADHEMLSDK